MIVNSEISLAKRVDARDIASVSRAEIESGLSWRWTPSRVLASIRDPDTSVPVLRVSAELRGFAIMRYEQEEGHLLLLAVRPAYRRQGAATALMAWLETTALTAGIGLVYLETRVRSGEARAFYRKLGYREIQRVRGYYQGREDAVRFGKDLWSTCANR